VQQQKPSSSASLQNNQDTVIAPPSRPYVETSDSYTEDSLPPLLDPIDRQFFLSAQKLNKNASITTERLSNFVDEEEANINSKYFTSGSPACWDVVMVPPGTGESTHFSWPSPEHRATFGDTLLHIAIKCKDKPLLGWLADRNDVDLNAVNGEGLTASMVADGLGFQNVYNYYFVIGR